MSNEIARQVEDAQYEMMDAVLAAVSAFTKKTGLIVSDVNWDTRTAIDANGNSLDTVYYELRSRIASAAG